MPSTAGRTTLVAVLTLVIVAGATGTRTRAQDAGRLLRFGMTTGTIIEANPADARAASMLWMQGVAESIGMRGAASEVFETIELGQQALGSAGLDILALTTVEFLEHEQRLSCRAAMAYEVSGEITQDYVLVSRDRSATLANVAGKALAVYTPSGALSLSLAWADTRTREAGTSSGLAGYASVRHVVKKGQAAMAVFFKQADFGIESRSALALAVELNPQMGRDLVVLDTSPALLPGLVCLSNQLPADVGRRYVERATHLHEELRYKQTFLVMRMTRVVEFKPSYLDTARALIAKQRALARKR